MENLNIIEIIKQNPLKQLTSNNQNKFITKIINDFSTEEQQIFIINFYGFLHYKNSDYIINLDNIWKLIGFARKDACKVVLLKFAVLDIDYKILLSNEYKKQGGRNKEIILMNIKTFKKLCLKSKTKKADTVHEYYIKLEEIFMTFVNEELEEIKNKFDNIKIILKKKDIEYENYKIKTIKEKENTLLEIFNYKSIVYLIHIDNKLYKFGITDDIKTRFNNHKKNIGEHIRLIYCIESYDNILLESNFKDYLFTTNYRRNKVFNHINYTELLEIDDVETIKNILIEFNNTLNTNKLLIHILKNKIKMLQKIQN
jgi:hypothetical protein